jgi:hypothetical protein
VSSSVTTEPRTWSSHQTNAPNPSTAIAAVTQGRYVRVQLTGAGYLSLAEVQVFGTGTNPPPGKVATHLYPNGTGDQRSALHLTFILNFAESLRQRSPVP